MTFYPCLTVQVLKIRCVAYMAPLPATSFMLPNGFLVLDSRTDWLSLLSSRRPLTSSKRQNPVFIQVAHYALAHCSRATRSIRTSRCDNAKCLALNADWDFLIRYRTWEALAHDIIKRFRDNLTLKFRQAQLLFCSKRTEFRYLDCSSLSSALSSHVHWMKSSHPSTYWVRASPRRNVHKVPCQAQWYV